MLSLLALALGAGCGPTTVSCQVRTVGADPTVIWPNCVEVEGADPQRALEESCTSTAFVSQTFLREPCPGANKVGGCRNTANYTTWFYAETGLKPAGVAANCVSQGGTPVEP